MGFGKRGASSREKERNPYRGRKPLLLPGGSERDSPRPGVREFWELVAVEGQQSEGKWVEG